MTGNSVSGLVESGSNGFGYFAELLHTKSGEFVVTITSNKFVDGSGAVVVVTGASDPLLTLVGSTSRFYMPLAASSVNNNYFGGTKFGYVHATLNSNHGPWASNALVPISSSILTA